MKASELVSAPALPGPFGEDPSPEGLELRPATLNLVRNQVRALLESSPSFYDLPAARRKEMARNLVKIGTYSAALIQEDWAQSKRLGQTPVLKRQEILIGPGMALPAALPEPAPRPSAAGRPIARALQKEAPAPADEFSPRAANQVARITRETLNAVAFPTFVADLIKGTFQAIVDASIQQMEAYGELLANVAKTVDQFMADNITDNQARDWLASSYPGHFQVEVGRDNARLRVRRGAEDLPMPDFRRELGLQEELSLDEDAIEKSLVPAARRRLAQSRHQMLSTMVLLGINRIVVTNGKIRAQMAFRIDTQDHGAAASASQFDFRNETTFGAGGGLHSLLGGPSVKTRNTIAYVSSSKRESSDDIDVSASLTGEVELKFKSDYFPLDRLSTPEMLSAIQGNTVNPAANQPNTGAGTGAGSGQGTET